MLAGLQTNRQFDTQQHTIKNLVAHKFYSDEQRQQGWRGENEESEQKSLKFTQVIVKNV